MKRTILLLITAIYLSCLSYAQTGHFIPSERFSSSLISDLCQDHQGSVWIATDYGLNRFDGYRFQTFLHSETDTTSLSVNVVVSLLCDSEGRLWVGTNRGLDRFDAETETFIHYPFPSGLMPRVSSIIQRKDGTLLVGTAGYGLFSLSVDRGLQLLDINAADDFFSYVFEDSKGRLWRSSFNENIDMFDGKKLTTFQSKVGNPASFVERDGVVYIVCMHGIMTYRNGQMQVASLDMGSVSAKDMVFTTAALSEDNDIYIGTRGQGVYRLKVNGTLKLEHVGINAFGIDAATAKITSILFDRNGNLWLGCHRKGILLVPLRPMQFSNWSFQSQGINIGSTISSVCEGDGGIIWCTVQGVGVYGFNSQGRVAAHPQAPEAVEFIFRDQQKRYWVGTVDGLYAYDPLTGRYQQKVTFDCDRFNDMTSDREGRIYISTFSRGFCVYNPQTGNLHNYNFSQKDSIKGELCNNWILGMSSDSQGFIWMATSSGVSCFDPHTDSFRSQGWNSLLDGVVCFDVCELHNGVTPDGTPLNGSIAIGTEQGLYLYNRQTHQVERFPESTQLHNKTVCYIVQSNDGDIWCSTSDGIWQYQQSTHTFIGHIIGNGLTQREYLYGVGMHTDSDHIYFGHSDGLTTFLPRDVKVDKAAMDSLQLMAFFVGGQAVHKGLELNGVVVTDQAVSESTHFTLSYLDHTITLAFSQMNFDNPMNVTYEYCVDGGNWIHNPAGNNEFTLSHLRPGSYRIQVRASKGGEYTPEKVVYITVRSPWYSSTLAYIIYIAVLVGLAVFVLLTLRRRAHQQMDEEKMKFLINATHDIRSPLTLIMSPLTNLKRHIGSEQADAQRDISTIEHNAQRILNLVNQILDVRKIDKQQMQLHCQRTDLVAFINGICKMFEYNAQERNITFRFTHEAPEMEVWIDRSQFDKVVTNLLSNAFKYSYDGGTIEISLRQDDQQAVVQVTDNGVGLDGDSLKHIFDRFYQGGNSRRMHIHGTGIGLNLCKMIVDMHHGTIEARNRSGEKGALFEVRLPLGNAHLQESEIDNEPEVEKTPAPAQKPQGSRHRVLIVDDDQEICHYISTELGRYYKFTIVHNGKEGLKELLTRASEKRVPGDNEYDVVISDVMMPEMDGFTMLRMIKTNANISHIPVIMLTSKADVGHRLEGLERGADAFLAKPFDMDELRIVIENLIQGRQRLKGKYSGAQQQADKVEQPEVKGNDELLMERIMKSINKNLSNSDFNVDMLTQEVGISRAQLHRKMKEMTGISTSEFIRNIRLEQAARLLKEQKINVTQVAYTVGFSNLAHFSTIFRRHFGVAPSEYAEIKDGE